MNIKSIIRKCVAQIYRVGIHPLNRIYQKSRNDIIILMYHRVVEPNDIKDYVLHPGIYVTPATFEMQMKYLKEACRVISFEQYLDCPILDTLDSKVRCIVTFDDGWKDNFYNAFPILKKYGVPATIFMPTGFIGTDQWFWQHKLSWQIEKIHKNPILLSKIKALNNEENELKYLWAHPNIIKIPELYLDIVVQKIKKCRNVHIDEIIRNIEKFTGFSSYPPEPQVLDEKEMAMMSSWGTSFGSHGVTHRMLTDLSDYEADAEIRESKEYLKMRNVNFIPVIAYPNGNFNIAIQDKARQNGYKAAVTTIAGRNTKDISMFALRRINIHEDISSSVSLFSFKLDLGGQC